MSVYTCDCVCLCSFAHLQTRIFVFMHIYVPAWLGPVFGSVYTCRCVSEHMCVQVYVCVCVCVGI